MIHRSPGISIEVMWVDDYLCEIEIQASNRVFSGCISAYINESELTSLIENLAGFPNSNEDERMFSFGSFDRTHAGGGARLRFFCTDGLAHIGVEVELRSDQHTPSKRSERCTAFIPLEPAAIDEFVTRLKSMPIERGLISSLPMAT